MNQTLCPICKKKLIEHSELQDKICKPLVKYVIKENLYRHQVVFLLLPIPHASIISLRGVETNNNTGYNNSTSKIQFTTMLLYAIRPILNSLSDYVGTIAAKRYHLYQKEEERKRRHSEWAQYVIAAILWLVKLITNSLEKVNMKSKRVIEKVTVE